ncbi:PH domain-containing protein [Bacillus sp. REN10]|uniref:PH domain-containing protein n=1 Tax=Bacillus sp. REN10 TaxID=2782541 RepID=UPI00193B365C|nr:PH domain-containing protein [Bacillus sp. REN10]
MFKPKRLHPIAAVSNVLQELKNLIFPLVLVFFVNNKEKVDVWDYLPMIGMGVLILFLLISGVVKWIRFTYWVEESELRIEHGLFVKKKRYIPIERIQSIDVSEGLLQQMFSLVKVKIETAGSSDPMKSEAELTAITKEEADALKEMISREKNRFSEEMEQMDGNEEAKETATVIYKAKLSELLLLAATSGGIGVVISAVIAFLSQFDELIPYEKVFLEVSRFIEYGVIIVSLVVFIILCIAWIISVVLTLLKYHDFTLEMNDEHLVIRRGLLEKRQIMLPFSRIQGMTIVENPLRQIAGYCSVQLESAGGADPSERGASNVMLPMIKKESALTLLKEVFPDYSFPKEFHSVPKKAMRRYIFRKIYYVIIPVVGISWYLWPSGLWSFVLLLLAAVYGISCYRSAGWIVIDDQLTIRYRRLDRCTVMMKKSHIQSVELTQAPWQKKKGLASFSAVIKSGAAGKKAKVIDASLTDASCVYRWYEREDQHEMQVKQ